MSKFVQVEVCANGTISRASARALNRALVGAGKVGGSLSGSTSYAVAVASAEVFGVQVRLVQAAALSGAAKARHTREVTRSRKAQVARVARKAAAEYEDEMGYEVAV